MIDDLQRRKRRPAISMTGFTATKGLRLHRYPSHRIRRSDRRQNRDYRLGLPLVNSSSMLAVHGRYAPGRQNPVPSTRPAGRARLSPCRAECGEPIHSRLNLRLPDACWMWLKSGASRDGSVGPRGRVSFVGSGENGTGTGPGSRKMLGANGQAQAPRRAPGASRFEPHSTMDDNGAIAGPCRGMRVAVLEKRRLSRI